MWAERIAASQEWVGQLTQKLRKCNVSTLNGYSVSVFNHAHKLMTLAGIEIALTTKASRLSYN